jgi:exo-1,4-beta-D-glucosaminidase
MNPTANPVTPPASPTRACTPCNSSGTGDPFTRELRDAWTLIPKASLTSGIPALHLPGWHHPEGLIVSVPCTVFGAQVDAGLMGDPFVGRKLEEYDRAPWQQPWIYRRVFDLDPTLPSNHVELIFEGFNFSANVWLNGTMIAESTTFRGPFRIYTLDVSNRVRNTDNVLVVEVIRPAKDDLTIGWVDWNAYPPDDNLGLWRPVKLRQTGPVSLEDVSITTDLELPSMDAAELLIRATLKNHSGLPRSGTLHGSIGAIRFSLPWSLSAGASVALHLDSSQFAGLRVRNPALWWPHTQGGQALHRLELEIVGDGLVSDSKNIRFGIRTVETYLNEQGHRGWKINGKPILIKGAGWVDDLFLRETPERVEAQARYARHMNLNTIRLEGFWCASQHLFDLCDELGILLMIGWSCHWEWENYCGRPADNYLLIKTPEDIVFHSRSFREQVAWMRHHPSIFTWVYGSDMIPRPELERALEAELDAVDTTRPRLVGCRQKSQDGKLDFTSEVSGPVAVKMVGPYSYVPPIYWTEDRSIGGAYGFNTETGPGLQPVVYESLIRFTPEEDLWPINKTWAFHTGRGVFATFDYWLPAFNARYGEARSAEDFCYRAQMSNYEAMRAMFEGFAINQGEATGVIQWMLNSALPNHLWQLYDHYLMPTGAFYGARQACRPLNVAFGHSDRSVWITHDGLDAIEGLTVTMQALDLQSRLLWQEKVTSGVPAQASVRVGSVPAFTDLCHPTWFLLLKLERKDGTVESEQCHWLSTQRDICNYAASDWHFTPCFQHADLSGTRELPQTQIDTTWSIGTREGSAEVNVHLHNSGERLAFFMELALINPETDRSLLPIHWDDNYLTLAPGARRTITARVHPSLLQGVRPTLRLQGMNIATRIIPLS